MEQLIKRTRANAKTEFSGIPSRFRFKVGDRYFPYAKEAHEALKSIFK